MPHDFAEPGDWIEGPFWNDPVQVVSIAPHYTHQYDVLTVYEPAKKQTQMVVFTEADWQQTHRVIRSRWENADFDGDPTAFRLAIEAYRLRLAHSIDPYAALNASRVDPLPHQFEAVYEHLLARPTVRALLAHDAGAGKTIMAGLLIKELKRRQGIRRVLIVAPAGLTTQWRRELLTKFGEDLTLIDRKYMQRHRLDALQVWRETDFAITSVDFARQKIFRAALESVEWDMVIVDEAHKMAAYRAPDYDRRTQAYSLGQVLSRHATHFLLMTATPHKGDPENYRFLVRLVNPHWGDALEFAGQAANPVVLRRTKEEMVKPDGSPLYPERIVAPMEYHLSPREGEVLEQLYKFVRARYAKAQAKNRLSAVFALITLERRFASSPYALRESLLRIRRQIEDRLERRLMASHESGDDANWLEWDELTEEERWEREERAEGEIAGLSEPRELQAELRQVNTLITNVEAILGQQQKLAELQRACEEWVGEKDEQLIIFTEFKDTLDYLRAALHEWGYTTTEIHGGMVLKDRRKAERDFWDGKAKILLATEAAGEGINLQCCSVMVNFDIPWNPGRLEQRMGRIHRYGQKATQVFIFNMIATNSMEGQVKQALLSKLQQMRGDLDGKVFDVVGSILSSEGSLRDVLTGIALGDANAVRDAENLIDRAAAQAQAALDAERQAVTMAQPLDVARFQQRQAEFRARRLSPEAAERFFREAIPFIGGTLHEFTVEVEDKAYAAFEVTLPGQLFPRRPNRLTVSFWGRVCTDDETDPNAVHFIAPGHWLLDGLLDKVIADAAPALDSGAVFFDIHPQDERPYLIWFVKSHIRDGLNRQVRDLLTAVAHQADQEEVRPVATEILHAFDMGDGSDRNDAIRRVKPFLSAQTEVIGQCVDRIFLPELMGQRSQQHQIIARDRDFLEQGLSALADELSDRALEAYAAGGDEEGNRQMERSANARDRLNNLRRELGLAEQLLMMAPDVLGVALVIPSPLPITVPSSGQPMMRQDREVEATAMARVMRYEREHGRTPRDVSAGNSWDIESTDHNGVITRYIEVKGRGPADANEVMLTEPEWEAAERLGILHWLYIVRIEDGMLWMIPNPYQRLQPRELKRFVVRIQDVLPYAEIVEWKHE
ncbi:MAG: DUF3883 domain-containing protein [Anaerolineae bacterium]|nr:DUF3883 domain-containing protein [Anaerolineae bacterium]